MRIPPMEEEYKHFNEGGDLMTNYKLTVEVLEVRVAPVGFSLGGQ
jgi:hypothetical protein